MEKKVPLLLRLLCSICFITLAISKPDSKNFSTCMSSNSDYPSVQSAASSSAREIQSCFDKWAQAWNEGDINGYLDGYSDIPSVRYVSTKMVTRGKENIVKLFQERGAKGKLSLLHLESDIIGQDDAICFGQYRLVEECHVDGDNSGNQEEKVHEGCFTVHVRRIQNEWKIISDHSS